MPISMHTGSTGRLPVSRGVPWLQCPKQQQRCRVVPRVNMQQVKTVDLGCVQALLCLTAQSTRIADAPQLSEYAASIPEPSFESVGRFRVFSC